MHHWSKLADLRWLTVHEDSLQSHANGKLAVISSPGRKRVRLEVTCASRKLTQELFEQFGGRVVKWPRNWLKRFVSLQRSKPIKIGSRLSISPTLASRTEQGTPPVARCPTRCSPTYAQLVIPASAAFGTGEHATTAMSLRLLEHVSRKWKKGWSLADVGTGSGILALSAKRLGAGRVIGIDIDPKAISVAKANARLNQIDNANFQLADVRRWKPRVRWDVIAANLYSELLIEVVPKLRRANWLILSGVLRRQEDQLLGVLQRNGMEIASVKRRGKWIAVLGSCRTPG